MANSRTNPIDPSTGKPRRGRPPKVTPIDTIAGPQPEEKAVREPAIFTAPVDPEERATTELLQAWKSRHRSRKMLDVPDEYRKAYPDGDFCWARNTSEGVSDYKTNFEYDVAKLPEGSSMAGQSDSTCKFHDVILMVRPKWMRKAHAAVNRERVLEQMGKVEPRALQQEREAYREAGGTVTFLGAEESADDPEDPGFLREPRSRLDGERARAPRFASGTKYVQGGIPS